MNVDNVNKFYELIKDKNAEVSGPPENKPWFMREMLVKDPDGHILRVGQILIVTEDITDNPNLKDRDAPPG